MWRSRQHQHARPPRGRSSEAAASFPAGSARGHPEPDPASTTYCQSRKRHFAELHVAWRAVTRTAGSAPRPVRYTSVTTLTPRTTAARIETTRDKKKTARYAAYMQRTGRFRRWWQVLGSNQRRLSRRFYRPFPLATRATCRSPPVLCSAGQAQRRIAQDASRCATRPPVLHRTRYQWRHRDP